MQINRDVLLMENRMKTAMMFVASAALFALGSGEPASFAPRADGKNIVPATRPASDTGSMVKDVRVEVALFGSGTHLADVTDRVVQLLRSEPQGFTARADLLHIDPLPGKNKSLLIRYRYHDQERLYLITGGNRASYSALVEGDDDR
jgi:hypothetical protein